MSFLEKTPYSSSYIDKKESISEQDSPRRLKVALKKFLSDEKFHNDGMPTDACTIAAPATNNHIESTSNETPSTAAATTTAAATATAAAAAAATAVDESVKSPDGIVPKVSNSTNAP